MDWKPVETETDRIGDYTTYYAFDEQGHEHFKLESPHGTLAQMRGLDVFDRYCAFAGACAFVGGVVNRSPFLRKVFNATEKEESQKSEEGKTDSQTNSRIKTQHKKSTHGQSEKG